MTYSDQQIFDTLAQFFAQETAERPSDLADAMTPVA